jgi:LPS-assembly protein
VIKALNADRDSFDMPIARHDRQNSRRALPAGRAGLAGVAGTLALIMFWQQAVRAAETVKNVPYDREAPVLVKADEAAYDQELGIVTARGHVELSQSDRVLLADTVSYNQKTGVVIASGNVSMMEPTGEVMFANFMELHDQMRDGFAKDMRLLLSDDSRAAANTGKRTDGNRTVLDKAVYSACDLCQDHPEDAPLWQIKAITIIHDQEAQRIYYKNAVMEVYGVPVFYTPYFSSADPTVKRASGFLAPTYGHDTNLGFLLKTPYYYVISPSADVTLEPWFMTNTPPLLFMEYRQRTDDGRFIIESSITKGNPDPVTGTGARFLDDEVRGHIFGTGRFNLDDDWKAGFDIARTTDDTYLLRYHFSNDDTLTTDAFVQGFHDRSYAEADAFAFQGLLITDVPGISPLVLPFLQYQYVGQPNRYGAYYTLDSNALSIYRTQGEQTRRLSSTVGWNLPYTAAAGDVFNFRLQLRGDGYDVSPGLDPTGSFFVHESGGTGRVEPLAYLEWRYPFVRSAGSVQEVIEPIISAVATPNGGNPAKIPNEDSQNVEFDDTNLFSIIRFPGLDRYEGGERMSYGLHGALYGLSGGYTDVLVGQSIRARADDSTFPIDTGLDKQVSDIVGHVSVVPSPWLDVTERFRMDHANLRVHRNEITLGTGPTFARFSVSYVQIDNQLSQTQFGERQELGLGMNLQFTRYWHLSASWLRDLSDDPTDIAGTLDTNVGLHYTDECVDILFSLERQNIRDQDIQPSTSFNVKFTLRNLG